MHTSLPPMHYYSAVTVTSVLKKYVLNTCFVDCMRDKRHMYGSLADEATCMTIDHDVLAVILTGNSTPYLLCLM